MKEIEHYGVWINNNVYHWGSDYKSWSIYGEKETNREIANEWEVDEEHPKTYFTIRSIAEIENFCDKYQKTKYDLEKNNSYHFKTKLLNFLGIE